MLRIQFHGKVNLQARLAIRMQFQMLTDKNQRRGSSVTYSLFGVHRPWFKLMLISGILASAQLLVAQDEPGPDKVVLAIGGRTSTKTTITGEILEYTGETLRIRVKDGEAPREFSAADVIEVVTRQASAYSKGLALFDQQDYVRAAQSLRSAIESEHRTWVRREILAALVRCHLKQGDYLNAAARFAILYRSDPKTRQLQLLPLIWHTFRPDAAFRSEAEGWMLDEDEHPAIRLIGASALLEDPQLGTTATVALKELAANKDRRLGGLAGSQLWRLRLAMRKEVNLTELKTWMQRLDQLPEELRAGPRFLLGRAYASRKEFELAAVHYLWQPLVQPDDHFLAAQAMLNAADALNSIGQSRQAFQLYEEITVQFPTTTAAQEAAGQIQELTKSIRNQGSE